MMEANFTADSIREWSGKIVNPVLKRLDEVMKIVLKSKKDTCVPITKFEMVTESTIKVFHGSRSTVITIDWLNIDLKVLQEMFDSYDVLKEKTWKAVLEEVPMFRNEINRIDGWIRLYENGLENLSNPSWIAIKKEELKDHLASCEDLLERTKNKLAGKEEEAERLMNELRSKEALASVCSRTINIISNGMNKGKEENNEYYYKKAYEYLSDWRDVCERPERQERIYGWKNGT